MTIMLLSLVASRFLIAEGEIREVGEANCRKEELLAFFPRSLVQWVLVKQHFSSEEAGRIAEELAYKDKELTKKVEEKAALFDPNPLRDLGHRDLAIRLYRETLYEVFAKVLRAHGIEDGDRIQALLDEMQSAKSTLFIECIRRERARGQTGR